MAVLFACAHPREAAGFDSRCGAPLEIGVGCARAATSIARALASNAFDRVVLFGVAGAYRRAEIAPKSVVVVRKSVLADEGVETDAGFQSADELGLVTDGGWIDHGEGAARVAATELGARVVDAATVSRCSGTDALAAEIFARHGAAIETMESAAVAHACRASGVPLLEVRAISNYCGAREHGEWDVDGAVPIVHRAVTRLLDAGILEV